MGGRALHPAYIFLTGGLFFAFQAVLEPRSSEAAQGIGSLRYLFEEYGFDTDRRELHRGADAVSVAPQVFDLLDYLIRNRERVVSKDDLINAIWNGRSVSDAALTTRLNAARSAIGDSGEEQRLIKTLPRKGFRFVGTVREAQRPASAAVADNPVEPPKLALALPDKPSIAILPFTNLSSDPEQEYFADGMVEDIITALSRFKSLFVIARNSSFTYRGRAVDVKQVGRELGVRYVLEGSVQKAGDRVRITGQLVDASTGVHIWADHFDDALKDIFDLQDRVAARVVGEIAPRLSLVEIERAHRKPTGNLEAYDWYLRAIGNYFPVTKEASEGALRLLYKAIELDPAFASAYGIAAWYYAWRKINRWMTDPVQESAEAVRLARRAAELGKDDAFALAWAGYSLAAVARELEDGAACLDRALELNPNLAVAWGSSGWVRVWLGQPELAIEHLARAMRLSPLDPIMPGFQTALAVAHFLAGHYEDASSWATRAGRMGSYFLRTALILVAASQALSGQNEEARRAITRLRQLDPGLRLSNLRASTNIRGPEYVARLKEGLRKAGLPE